MLPSWEAAARLHGSGVGVLFMFAWIFGLINLLMLPLLIIGLKMEDAQKGRFSELHLYQPGQWIVCPVWLCGCCKRHDDREHINMAKPDDVEMSWQEQQERR